MLMPKRAQHRVICYIQRPPAAQTLQRNVSTQIHPSLDAAPTTCPAPAGRLAWWPAASRTEGKKKKKKPSIEKKISYI